MRKYIFWAVIHKNKNIALNEDLSRYAQGETFWQAMQNLADVLKRWDASSSSDGSDIGERLRMYNETGINKIEIFIEQGKSRFSIKCANSQSFINASSEEEALSKYIAVKAKTSVVNTGEPVNE
ncbi:MAG: hypothetical protein JXB26_20025 [Candidatus Aminicenantes bacterium]|nr:hypothetical protein [Candidatus Aminicenantes bacterium]